jgi:hypothetical protein
MQGRLYNLLGYFLAGYCIYKLVMVRGVVAFALWRLRIPQRWLAHHTLRAFQATINIIFDRVATTDPVTKGISLLLKYALAHRALLRESRSSSPSPFTVQWLIRTPVRFCHVEIDVPFWSQHISFLFVGIIIAASIRGFLQQLMKVRRHHLHTPPAALERLNSLVRCSVGLSAPTSAVLRLFEQRHVEQHHPPPRPRDGHVLCLLRPSPPNEPAPAVQVPSPRLPDVPLSCLRVVAR